MGMGPRKKRIKRLRALFPVLEEMELYAEQIRGDHFFHAQENPTSDDLWLPTPFEHTRDSELLAECNWEVITEAFSETCQDGYKEMPFGHWGYGWSERIYVRKDNAAAIKLTQEFVDALTEYGCLDDERYSRMESEKLSEYLGQQLSGHPGDEDEYIGRVREFLREYHDVYTLDDVDQDMVKAARLGVHHEYEQWVWDTETGEECCFYCEQPQSAGVHETTSVELEAAGQMRLPEQS